mmetsp:Transcript_19571/g.58681  ORF Transcript_19571/g.58681 Transcript_19571/m.58681 type:complete len:268 (+) Transcript_19571:418-1221(+)
MRSSRCEGLLQRHGADHQGGHPAARQHGLPRGVPGPDPHPLPPVQGRVRAAVRRQPHRLRPRQVRAGSGPVARAHRGLRGEARPRCGRLQLLLRVLQVPGGVVREAHGEPGTAARRHGRRPPGLRELRAEVGHRAAGLEPPRQRRPRGQRDPHRRPDDRHRRGPPEDRGPGGPEVDPRPQRDPLHEVVQQEAPDREPRPLRLRADGRGDAEAGRGRLSQGRQPELHVPGRVSGGLRRHGHLRCCARGPPKPARAGAWAPGRKPGPPI